jgi:plastocyanin
MVALDAMVTGLKMKMTATTAYVVIATAVLAMTGCATIAGTAGIAETSRTGAIMDVTFEERMTPVGLQVQVGDEVRWVNRRSSSVRLEFLEDALDDVVCQSGFSSFFRRQQESVSIKPNESASLCFGRVGSVRYNARMSSPVAGGQMIEPGAIYVVQ